jgi:hypothetical protein
LLPTVVAARSCFWSPRLRFITGLGFKGSDLVPSGVHFRELDSSFLGLDSCRDSSAAQNFWEPLPVLALLVLSIRSHFAAQLALSPLFLMYLDFVVKTRS